MIPRHTGWLAVALLVGGCAREGASTLPPPFDEDTSPVRFFFPAAVALGPAPANDVFVANGNFDQTYSRGTLVQLSATLFDEAATAPDRVLANFTAISAALVDNYAGRLAVNAAGTAAYLTSRGTGLLSRAPITSGKLACASEPPDCSTNAVSLASAGLVDPFALLLAEVAVPGSAAPQPAVVVSHLAPKSLGTGSEADPALVAVVPEPASIPADGPFSSISEQIPVGAVGSTSLALDPATSELFIGGCYQRVSPDAVQPCSSIGTTATTSVRSIEVDAGSLTAVGSVDLASLVGTADVQDLALSSDGRALYLVTQNPAALMVIDRPRMGITARAALRAVIPLARQPWHLSVLRRASGDVVAVTAFASDVLLLVDPAAESVVAEVRVGDGPFDLASRPTASGDRIFVTLFNACGVAAVDVPAAPSGARLIGTVGRCP